MNTKSTYQPCFNLQRNCSPSKVLQITICSSPSVPTAKKVGKKNDDDDDDGKTGHYNVDSCRRHRGKRLPARNCYAHCYQVFQSSSTTTSLFASASQHLLPQSTTTTAHLATNEPTFVNNKCSLLTLENDECNPVKHLFSLNFLKQPFFNQYKNFRLYSHFNSHQWFLLFIFIFTNVTSMVFCDNSTTVLSNNNPHQHHPNHDNHHNHHHQHIRSSFHPPSASFHQQHWTSNQLSPLSAKTTESPAPSSQLGNYYQYFSSSIEHYSPAFTILLPEWANQSTDTVVTTGDLKKFDQQRTIRRSSKLKSALPLLPMLPFSPLKRKKLPPPPLPSFTTTETPSASAITPIDCTFELMLMLMLLFLMLSFFINLSFGLCFDIVFVVAKVIT